MPDAATETPTAPTQDLGKTPTLLETLSQTMDLTGSPMIHAKTLPHITERKEKEKPEEKAEEKPPEEKPPEEKPKPEDKNLAEEWQKANETVAERMFKKRPPKEDKGEKGKPAEDKVVEEKPKGKIEDKPTPAPARRKRASEAEITERAAAAAAEAATTAMAKMAPKPDDKPLPKAPEDALTPAERKQFDVYQELESWKPDEYKGITGTYMKSLTEIRDYVKTWAKENPGQPFDPNDEAHNDFFARIEPPVDEDDWDDAKANIRAREISGQAIKPLNEKLRQMEQERARTMMEPVLQQKTLEGVRMLLNEFDPEIAAEIVKPDGLKELQEKDPITVGILNQTANILSALTAEIVRLHDQAGGVAFDPRNPAHKEIADFILGQEQRISKLPANDRMRDGKRFIGRLDYGLLPPDQKSHYWYLDQDDVTYLLAQKYALQAKKVRDAAVTEFNATAEKLGYKKAEGAKPGAKPAAAKPAQPANGKKPATSPEAVSRTSLKTATGNDGKPAPGDADVILGNMFPRLRS